MGDEGIKNDKQKKAPSLYKYVVQGILVLLLIIIIVTMVFIMGLMYVADGIYNPTQIDKIIEQQDLLKSEKYSDLEIKDYIGDKGYIEVIDSQGKIYYTSDSAQNNSYDEQAVQYIENINQDISYSVIPFYKKNDSTLQDGYLILRHDNSGHPWAYSDTEETLISTDNTMGIAVVDTNYNVLYTNMNFNGESISPNEIRYLLSSTNNNQNDGIVLQKYSYTTNSGEQRYLLIHYEGPYFGIVQKYNVFIIVSIVCYILVVLVAVAFLVLRIVRKFSSSMNGLKTAMDSISAGKRQTIQLESSTKEFEQVVETFNNMEQELQKSEETRSRMLADISHDLKTPITVIRGYVDAMRDGLIEKSDMQKYLELISDKADDLTELINSFSDYSRLEHPEYTFNKNKGDICEYIREYIADRYQELILAGYAIEVDIPEEKYIMEFDPEQMKRVFDNIISNFVKYTKSGATLYCEVVIDKGITIEIGDDGPGISKELREIIFEPFVVAESARNNGQGTGLGLSIVRKIVEGHNGEIHISDKTINGRGTFFVIQFRENI